MFGFVNSEKDKRMLAGVIFATLFVVGGAFAIGISSHQQKQTDETLKDSYNTEDNILGTKTMAESDSKLNKYSAAPGELPKDQITNKKSIIKTNKGTIEIELYADDAPLAVSNHIFLAKDKFYDGLTFHRREEGFVIQGGDPAGTGTGGPGYNFEDEPVMKEYDEGIVAMANAGPDTNGSQFFIMLSDYPLPPQYTIFGKVTSGMDIVKQIQVGDVMESVEIVDK